MAEKVTIMVLKVDLQCSKCYKKVKKVLCKFPQIQDQVYDEKNNTVTIKVVCCSPEKIRDKICCKGGGSIKSIEILKPKPPPPPKPAEKPKEKPAEPPKTAEKPKDPPKPAEKPKEKPADPPKPAEKPKEKPADPPKPAEKPKEKPAPEKPKEKPADPPKQDKPKVTFDLPPPPVAPGHPPQGPVQVGMCCTDCYEGRGGGPCYNPCYGQPVRYYDGYCGRPVYDSWGGGGGGYRGYYGSRCSEYFSEENPQGCSIM